MLKVYCYSRCSTCRKALKWLEENGIEHEVTDIKADHPDEKTLREYYAASGLPLKRFFNTSGIPYREMGLSKKLPEMSEDEQLALLATDGMLVKRPLVVGDDFVLTGFKEEKWAEKLIKNTPENETLNYYKDNADAFFEGTVSADMSYSRERFLKKLPAGARLLDLGCGSGRDTKAFLELGYFVDAVDGSEELCRRASEYTGIQVRCMLFQDLAAEKAYDGIWACASLLHLPRKELAEVFCKVRDALKPDGVLYTGFKYGTFEGMRTGRYYTDFTEDTFREFMSGIEGLAELEHWITSDVRPDRGEEKWFNILLRRSGKIH